MNISWPVWVHQVSQLSHFLTVLSSSITFYIYVAKHGKKELFRLTSSLSKQSLNIPTQQQRLLSITTGKIIIRTQV